jgi:Chaperone of endosialidase
MKGNKDMKTTSHLKSTMVPWVTGSIRCPPLRRVFLFVPLLLACFAVSQAVLPPPDGGYPGQNTAEGTNALFSLTTGTVNTALGFRALYSDTIGGANTATGARALQSNTTGGANTATGTQALWANTGSDNTAIGAFTMLPHTTGDFNTAVGAQALFSHQQGDNNTAVGTFALYFSETGNNNVALGSFAGFDATGSNNIDIGADGFDEDGTIRIGNPIFQTRTFVAGIAGVGVTGSQVFVSSSGQLGVRVSSERFKDGIKPMDKASEAILALKPVTFRYKKEIDPDRTTQFGLVAEQVEKVNPDLVARDADGKPYTVRYEAVNAMLLNEFLKEHRQVEEQQKEIDALRAELKEQRMLIQKVSARLKLQKAPAQTVANIR